MQFYFSHADDIVFTPTAFDNIAQGKEREPERGLLNVWVAAIGTCGCFILKGYKTVAGGKRSITGSQAKRRVPTLKGSKIHRHCTTASRSVVTSNAYSGRNAALTTGYCLQLLRGGKAEAYFSNHFLTA